MQKIVGLLFLSLSLNTLATEIKPRFKTSFGERAHFSCEADKNLICQAYGFKSSLSSSCRYNRPTGRFLIEDGMTQTTGGGYTKQKHLVVRIYKNSAGYRNGQYPVNYRDVLPVIFYAQADYIIQEDLAGTQTPNARIIRTIDCK